MYALDAATGRLRWIYTIGTVAPIFVHVGEFSPAVAGGIVYIGSGDDKVYALDAATGHLRWTYTIGTVAAKYDESSPAVAGGIVYIGSDDGKVYALDAAGS